MRAVSGDAGTYYWEDKDLCLMNQTSRRLIQPVRRNPYQQP